MHEKIFLLFVRAVYFVIKETENSTKKSHTTMISGFEMKKNAIEFYQSCFE